MVNPVGKIAVATGLAAVGLHKAYGDMKREQERTAAEVERKREQAARQDFREEMARASSASAAQRRAEQERSNHNREAFVELKELRVSLVGRALGDLRRALEEDFCRESPPLSSVGLPLIGRADSVDFAIAAVLLAWGDDEMLERFWPRRRRGEDGHVAGEEEGEGVDSVEAYRVGFCVQRCSPQTLKVVRSWLKNMAKFGPAGEWTVPMEDKAKSEKSYGMDNALFGIPSGPPRFNRCVDDSNDDMKLDRIALGTFLKGSDIQAVKVKIRSYDHFMAVSTLGHIDLVFASGLFIAAVNQQRSGNTSARYITPDEVGVWEGPGLYLAANFPLRKSKPQALARRQTAPTGRQSGAGYAIRHVEREPPSRRGQAGSIAWSVGDVQPLTKWLPSEKAWRRASAKEAFAQSMLSREAAALLDVLTLRACKGAGLWHFLAISGEPQRYAMSLLGIFESRDAGLLEETGKGKGEEVARVLAAALRKVVPPPAVREGGSREAMEALDVEIDTFVHGCYLELLRSLYALPMENFAGHTPADMVDSSIHYKLWSNVLAYVPNQPKLLQLALRDIEMEKRAAARAASRGSTPVWWAVLMAAAVSAAIVVLFVCTYERELSKSLFFLFGGGRLPSWVADRACAALGLVDPLTAPVVVVTIFEIFLKYCRPPTAATTEDDGCGLGAQERGGLGAALLWRVEAANEISCSLFRAVALATGLTPPGRRSREELMLKCEEWLRIWGLRQLHSNMASAARRGRITKQAALQLADGIFLYRAEQEAAAVAAAAVPVAGGGSVNTTCRGAGTLPGSVEEAEAFLNLLVVSRDDDGCGGDGEEWVDAPLPGSAVEGALNMAMLGAVEDDTATFGTRPELEAEGRRGGSYRPPGSGGGGGGARASGGNDEDSDDSEDSDDDGVSRPGGEQTQRRRRCVPTEERSYQHPEATSEAEEAAATPSSRRSGSTDEPKNSDDDGGGTKGMKTTVRRLLARRGWTFESGAGGMSYYKDSRSARANAAPPTRASVRNRFVESKTLWHDSVGVGGQWIKNVKTMMAMRSAEEVLARILPENS